MRYQVVVDGGRVVIAYRDRLISWGDRLWLIASAGKPKAVCLTRIPKHLSFAAALANPFAFGAFWPVDIPMMGALIIVILAVHSLSKERLARASTPGSFKFLDRTL